FPDIRHVPASAGSEAPASAGSGGEPASHGSGGGGGGGGWPASQSNRTSPLIHTSPGPPRSSAEVCDEREPPGRGEPQPARRAAPRAAASKHTNFIGNLQSKRAGSASCAGTPDPAFWIYFPAFGEFAIAADRDRHSRRHRLRRRGSARRPG